MQSLKSLESVTDMEKIPIDLRRTIALNLSPQDLISLCVASKEIFYKGICDDNIFWRMKIIHDYPEIIQYYRQSNLILKNPKNTYIRTFSKISEIIEKEVNRDYVKTYFKNREGLYDFIFSVYNDLRKKMPFKNEEDFLNDIEYLMEKYDYDYVKTQKKYLIDLFIHISKSSPLVSIYGKKFIE